MALQDEFIVDWLRTERASDSQRCSSTSLQTPSPLLEDAPSEQLAPEQPAPSSVAKAESERSGSLRGALPSAARGSAALVLGEAVGAEVEGSLAALSKETLTWFSAAASGGAGLL